MVDEPWQLENLLTGTYVDSTRTDHPGRVEGEGYRYRVTDIAVSEPDDLVSRALKRLGARMPFRVDTTVRFDAAEPDPDRLADHPYLPGADVAVERDGADYRFSCDVLDRRHYGTRFAAFQDAVDAVVGEQPYA